MFNKCVPKIVQFKRYVEKYSTAGKATYENLTERMCLARWIPKGIRHRHRICILTALPSQRWLRDRASLL